MEIQVHVLEFFEGLFGELAALALFEAPVEGVGF